MSTILGEKISLVRPERYHRPCNPKECFIPHYNKRARTRKIGKREMQRLIEEFFERRTNGAK